MEMALSPPPPPKQGRPGATIGVGRIVPPPPPPRAVGEDSVREKWKKMTREEVKVEKVHPSAPLPPTPLCDRAVPTPR